MNAYLILLINTILITGNNIPDLKRYILGTTIKVILNAKNMNNGSLQAHDHAIKIPFILPSLPIQQHEQLDDLLAFKQVGLGT
jgi:hypothetical protein